MRRSRLHSVRWAVATAIAVWLGIRSARPAVAEPTAAAAARDARERRLSPVAREARVTRVVDGDTVWVDGLDASLRLLGIDTEETFKTKRDRRDFAAGWEAYRTAKRGGSLRPAKYATPLGEDAKHFAQRFFAGVDRVRIERDDPAEIHDRYGRYLAYVLVRRADGGWSNYNIECVRAGMAPYFTKYGRSRRYDADFVAAEAEARAAGRGIWAAGAEAYPDYAERQAWWNARADFVDAFRRAAAGRDDHVDLGREAALAELAADTGREVTVLGTVAEVREARAGGRGPARVLLSRRPGEDLPIVIFDREVLARSGLGRWRGEYVTVRGSPSMYGPQVQIVVTDPAQVTLSPVPGLGRAAP